MSDTAQEVLARGDEHRWPCESCGADLRFAPGVRQLTCDHCGHVQTIPDAPQGRGVRLGEIPLRQGLDDDLPHGAMEEPKTTPCPNCGALVEFQGASHATECPFCATPVVVGTGTNRQIKPQAVVPFRLTEPQARDAMTKWLGRLWFAPNGLVEYARKGRAMNGVYTPYWTFDAATRSQYAGQRGDHYTVQEQVVVNGKRETRSVTKVRWTAKRGQVGRAFDDVLVLASRSLPQGYTQNLAPWDLSDLKAYRPDYLAGFTAEGYTVPLAEGHETGRQIMAQTIREDVRRDIGGDEQRIDRIHTDWSEETFKHILLPVWLAAFKYEGRTFRFVVNGQTGKVQGERPWSTWKIVFAILLAIIAVAAIAWASQDPDAQRLLNSLN